MRRLVIVRPEPGASATVERARTMGLDAAAMPLFEVEAVAWEVPDTHEFDALLLTSANAVRRGGAGLAKLRDLPVLAVGEATAAAARDAGFEVAGVGEGGVEQLLGAIPADMRLLHLCGEHRLGTEAKQPIVAVPVYRASERPLASDLRQIEGATVAVHSPRAGQRLAELVESARIERGTVRIAAISEAAATSAGTGWEMCIAADAPNEPALLALAARLCDNPVTR
ncbi:MAG: uroporphyrinogen-III synthase [Sphingomicrobium sp.]